MWAEMALAMEVPLIAAIPFRSQASRWPAKAQKNIKQYLTILTQRLKSLLKDPTTWSIAKALELEK